MEYLARTDYNKLEVEFYDGKTITTKVNSINLHLFDNQIGLLSITTEKQEGDNTTGFDDFLRYNDVARRVYPPYLGKEDNTCTPKFDSILPVKISLYHRENNHNPIMEDFAPIDLEDLSHKGYDFWLSKIIQKLLEPFELLHKENMKKGKIYYTPYIDDRMFVVSYYSDKELSDGLKKRCCDRYVYETADEWYKFIFVDGNDIGIQNNAMKKELIQKHTYSRWADGGTLYGMSRYSFVMLCSTEAPPYLKQYMKSMYYQIALMVLFQRAMLLKFAGDVDSLTNLFEKEMLHELREKANELQGDFIKFINKYWFVEVTPQEQGIEIYNQWMGLLNLERLYNEVQSEISQLSEYVENKIESETNKKVAIITHIGFPLMVISLVLSLWQIYEGRTKGVVSLGIYELCKKAWHVYSFKLLLVPIGVIVLFAFLFWLIPKIKKWWHRFWRRN
ncbi:MAG: hypothetical protein ABH886_04695 [Candidatus Desantisbacteria bacterium]